MKLATIDRGVSARVPLRTTGWISTDPAEVDPAVGHLRDWVNRRPGVNSLTASDVVLVFGDLLTSAIRASAVGQEIRYSYGQDGSEIFLRVLSQAGQEIAAGTTEALASGKLADRMQVTTVGRQVGVTAAFIL